LQLANYAKLEKVAKSKTNEILKTIDNNNIILKTLDNINSIPELTDNYTNYLEKLNASKYKLETLSTDKSKLELVINELTNAITINITKTEQFNNNKKQLSLKLTSLESDYSKYNTRLKQLAEDGKKEVLSLKESKSKLESISIIDTTTLKINKDQLSDEILNIKTSLSQLTLDINKLKSPFQSGETCTECNQEISKEHLDDCKSKLDDLNARYSLLKVNLQTKTKQLNDLTESINLNDKNILLKNNLESKCSLLSTQVAHKKSQYKEYQELYNTTKDNLEAIKQELSLCTDLNISKITGKINEDKKLLSMKKYNLDSINEEITTLNKLINTLTSNVAVANDRLKKAKADLQKQKLILKEQDILQTKYKLHQKVSEAFSTTGIPNLIIHTILEDLQVESNQILSDLYPGIQLKFNIVKDNSKGELSDTLDILYYFNGYECDFLQLSGGQRLMISLSLRLGLANIMYKRLGTKLQFILLDEVDQALDKASLDIFIDLVKKLQKDFTVLVITHNDFFKEKFQKAILIEQDDNYVSTAKIIDNY